MFPHRRLHVVVLIGLSLLPVRAWAETKSAYPFKVEPAQAFDLLGQLEKASGLKVTLSSAEVQLFAAAREHKAVSAAEAALLASGVRDDGQRQKLLAQIDTLESKAREALAGAATTSAKAEKLLQFLHDGPMAKGYSLDQTDLDVLLNTGKFNCVSSAMLYAILGERLGLQVKAVKVPNHVFCVVMDGRCRLVVETTNAKGFNPKERERKGHEVDALGVAASIYYNHGVKLNNEKRFHEAAVANFSALSLDRNDPEAIQNAKAALTNWGLDLATRGKFDEAIHVCDVGIKLNPADSVLKNNRRKFWVDHAEAAMKLGKADEAVAILRKAAIADPTGNFETFQAQLYFQRGEELIRAGKWEDALTAVTPGLTTLEGKARERLRSWRVDLFLRWSQDELNQKNYEKALEILVRGRSLEPKEGRLENNIVATFDTWADGFINARDWAAAIRIYERGLQTLPGHRHLTQNLEYCKQQQGAGN